MVKKRPKQAAKNGQKAEKKKAPQTSPGHKGRFNQLLDDAVLGVKKK